MKMSPSNENEQLDQPSVLNLFCPRQVHKKKKPSSLFSKTHSAKKNSDNYEDDPIPIPSSFVDGYAAKLAELERDFFNDESPIRQKRNKKRDENHHCNSNKNEAIPEKLNCVTTGSKDPSSSPNLQSEHTYRIDNRSMDESDIINKSKPDDDPKVQCSDPETRSLPPQPTSRTEVTNIQLYQAVHDCFRTCDPNAAGTKSITNAVSQKLGTKLDKNQKQRITEHLRNLVREYQPNPLDLETAVDQEFGNVKERNNVENVIPKEFIHALQRKFHVPFGPQTMNLVKQRVAHLLVLERQSTEESSKDEPGHSTTCFDNTNRTEQTVKKVTLENDQNMSSECEAVNHVDDLESRPEIPVGEVGNILSTSVSDHEHIPSSPEKETKIIEHQPGSSSLKTKSNSSSNDPEIEFSNVTSQQEKSHAMADFAPVIEHCSLKNQRRKGGQRKKPTKCSDKGSNVEVFFPNQDVVEISSPGTKTTAVPGRKRARSCNLCSKCPCKITSRESISSLDLSHSDVAIEKSLIKRLLKLEAMADKYDEQTEAVRRQLYKHRREMYKKRTELLKRCNGAEPRGQKHHFLPDVQELDEQFLKEVRTKRPRYQVSKAQEKMFARQSKSQPTLTQMMGATAEEITDENPSCEHLNPDCTSRVTADRRDEIASEDFCTIEEKEVSCSTVDSPVPSLRVEATAKKFSTSIWDAVKNGNFDSCWDKLFSEESCETGVDYLLELFGDDSEIDISAEEDELSPPLSQSSLSQRGKSLANSLTYKVSSDPTMMAAIEQCCPHWKENIVFAMRQKEPGAVNDALTYVQETREKLERARTRILTHLESYDRTFSLFEEILNLSLTRFSSPATEEENASLSSNTEMELSPEKPNLISGCCSALLSQQNATFQNLDDSSSTEHETEPGCKQLNRNLVCCHSSVPETDSKLVTGKFLADQWGKLHGTDSLFSIASQ